MSLINKSNRVYRCVYNNRQKIDSKFNIPLKGLICEYYDCCKQLTATQAAMSKYCFHHQQLLNQNKPK